MMLVLGRCCVKKNKLTASGSLKISNGFITAEGIDNRRNKIKFISKKIYE